MPHFHSQSPVTIQFCICTRLSMSSVVSMAFAQKSPWLIHFRLWHYNCGSSQFKILCGVFYSFLYLLLELVLRCLRVYISICFVFIQVYFIFFICVILTSLALRRSIKWAAFTWPSINQTVLLFALEKWQTSLDLLCRTYVWLVSFITLLNGLFSSFSYPHFQSILRNLRFGLH